jgi:hypothetical protein
MSTSSGLSLALEGEGREDPRLRFAKVHVARMGDGDEIELVTDARGRMRYRLPAGRYRVQLEGGERAVFEITTGWTGVRLALF